MAGNGFSGDYNDLTNTPGILTVPTNVSAFSNDAGYITAEQCWMRDNLRTTTSPSTGTYLIPAANANYTYTGKQARWYNNDSATYAPMNYGFSVRCLRD